MYVNSQGVTCVTVVFKGQSNSQGQGDYTQSPILTSAQAEEWIFTPVGTSGGTGIWYPLQDPVSRNLVASMKANTGSYLPKTCEIFNTLSSKKVVTTHYAVSGTALLQEPGTTSNTNWSIPANAYPYNGGTQISYGTLYSKMYVKIDKMLQNLGTSTLDCIVLSLGETDGLYTEKYKTIIAQYPNGTITAKYPSGYSNPSNLPDMYTMYVNYFNELKTKYPGVKIVIVQTGVWNMKKESGVTTPYTASAATLDHYNGSFNIQDIQAQLAANVPDVYLVTGQSGFTITEKRTDGIHYNQVGLNSVGTRVGALLSTIL